MNNQQNLFNEERDIVILENLAKEASMKPWDMNLGIFGKYEFRAENPVRLENGERLLFSTIYTRSVSIPLQICRDYGIESKASQQSIFRVSIIANKEGKTYANVEWMVERQQLVGKKGLGYFERINTELLEHPVLEPVNDYARLVWEKYGRNYSERAKGQVEVRDTKLYLQVGQTKYEVRDYKHASEMVFEARKEMRRRNVSSYIGTPVISDNDGAVLAHVGVAEVIVKGAPQFKGAYTKDEILYDPIPEIVRADEEENRTVEMIEKTSVPAMRASTMAEKIACERAEPVNDLQGNPTGWKQIIGRNNDSLILVSSDGRMSVPFKSADLTSGTASIRMNAQAYAFAIDHPYECVDLASVGRFSGKIIKIESGIVTQKIGRSESDVVKHDLTNLNMHPVQGEVIDINYTDGVGVVSRQERAVER
jgi:hypothetical protein